MRSGSRVELVCKASVVGPETEFLGRQVWKERSGFLFGPHTFSMYLMRCGCCSERLVSVLTKAYLFHGQKAAEAC